MEKQQRSRDRGAVLVVALIMLAMVTFMVVAFVGFARFERASVTAAMRRTEVTLLNEGTGFLVQQAVVKGLANGPITMVVSRPQSDLEKPPVFIDSTGNGVHDFESTYLNLNAEINQQGGWYQEPNVRGGGDPQWVGILSDPTQPHSNLNRFAGRMAYMAVPLSQTFNLRYAQNPNNDFPRGGARDLDVAPILAELHPEKFNVGGAGGLIEARHYADAFYELGGAVRDAIFFRKPSVEYQYVLGKNRNFRWANSKMAVNKLIGVNGLVDWFSDSKRGQAPHAFYNFIGSISSTELPEETGGFDVSKIRNEWTQCTGQIEDKYVVKLHHKHGLIDGDKIRVFPYSGGVMPKIDDPIDFDLNVNNNLWGKIFDLNNLDSLMETNIDHRLIGEDILSIRVKGLPAGVGLLKYTNNGFIPVGTVDPVAGIWRLGFRAGPDTYQTTVDFSKFKEQLKLQPGESYFWGKLDANGVADLQPIMVNGLVESVYPNVAVTVRFRSGSVAMDDIPYFGRVIDNQRFMLYRSPDFTPTSQVIFNVSESSGTYSFYRDHLVDAVEQMAGLMLNESVDTIEDPASGAVVHQIGGRPIHPLDNSFPLNFGIGGKHPPLGPWHNSRAGISPDVITPEVRRILQVAANIGDMYTGHDEAGVSGHDVLSYNGANLMEVYWGDTLVDDGRYEAELAHKSDDGSMVKYGFGNVREGSIPGSIPEIWVYFARETKQGNSREFVCMDEYNPEKGKYETLFKQEVLSAKTHSIIKGRRFSWLNRLGVINPSVDPDNGVFVAGPNEEWKVYRLRVDVVGGRNLKVYLDGEKWIDYTRPVRLDPRVSARISVMPGAAFTQLSPMVDEGALISGWAQVPAKQPRNLYPSVYAGVYARNEENRVRLVGLQRGVTSDSWYRRKAPLFMGVKQTKSGAGGFYDNVPFPSVTEFSLRLNYDRAERSVKARPAMEVYVGSMNGVKANLQARVIAGSLVKEYGGVKEESGQPLIKRYFSNNKQVPITQSGVAVLLTGNLRTGDQFEKLNLTDVPLVNAEGEPLTNIHIEGLKVSLQSSVLVNGKLVDYVDVELDQGDMAISFSDNPNDWEINKVYPTDGPPYALTDRVVQGGQVYRPTETNPGGSPSGGGTEWVRVDNYYDFRKIDVSWKVDDPLVNDVGYNFKPELLRPPVLGNGGTPKYKNDPFLTTKRWMPADEWNRPNVLSHNESYGDYSLRGHQLGVYCGRLSKIQSDGWYHSNSRNKELMDPGSRLGSRWFPVAGMNNNVSSDVGILGMVHRGTPWQTLYLKSANTISDEDWSKWAGSGDTRPVNDRRLIEALRIRNKKPVSGLFSVNTSVDKNWAGLLNGVVVPTITPSSPYLPSVGSGLSGGSKIDYFNNNGWAGIATAIGQYRGSLVDSNQTFVRASDLLAVPELTDRSPYLLTQSPVLAPDHDSYHVSSFAHEADIERIPHQILSSVKVGGRQFYQVYTFTEGLKPALSLNRGGGDIKAGVDLKAQTVLNYETTGMIAERRIYELIGAVEWFESRKRGIYGFSRAADGTKIPLEPMRFSLIEKSPLQLN